MPGTLGCLHMPAGTLLVPEEYVLSVRQAVDWNFSSCASVVNLLLARVASCWGMAAVLGRVMSRDRGPPLSCHASSACALLNR
jgi:hypothetical protein